jgi:hypothetical protein
MNSHHNIVIKLPITYLLVVDKIISVSDYHENRSQGIPRAEIRKYYKRHTIL